MAPQEFLLDYVPISIFFGLISILIIVVSSLSYMFTKKRKKSAEESVFKPKFDSKYYLTALLSMVFTLLIVFLIPWAMTLGEIGVFGFISMMIFLLILIVGFAYQWCKGAIE